MRGIRHQNRSQLKLLFEPLELKPLDGLRPKGVVETLADLLLEALGATPTKGGEDEHQDHA